jgi:hypothetical protein
MSTATNLLTSCMQPTALQRATPAKAENHGSIPPQQPSNGQGRTSIVLYSVEPLLVAGLRAVLAPLKSLTLSGVYSTVGPLLTHVQTERPDLLLVELTADITLEVLNALKSTSASAPVILFVGEELDRPAASPVPSSGDRGLRQVDGAPCDPAERGGGRICSNRVLICPASATTISGTLQ